MKYYVRKKPCKLKTNYIYHKMYTCFFLNSRPRKTDFKNEKICYPFWYFLIQLRERRLHDRLTRIHDENLDDQEVELLDENIQPDGTDLVNEHRCEKTGLRGFRPGPT